MSMVIGVRFKNAGKLYYFDPGKLWPAAGDAVIVETARGIEYAQCVMGVHEVSDDSITAPLKKVIRIAGEEDAEKHRANIESEWEVYKLCQQKIADHKLDMKLVKVEYTFDRSKLIAYFTSGGRVDFRALVKDLAAAFKTRIELKQIGVRDEAKMLGGLGSCGRPLCCSSFLGDFQPVSIKMAKEQSLSLNPTKISGVCGRLMCCLKYEQDLYERARKTLPHVGKDVMTPDGRGTVVELNPLQELVKVRIPKGQDSFEIHVYAGSEVQRIVSPQPQKTADRKKEQRSVPKRDEAGEVSPEDLSEDELDSVADPEE